MSIISALLRFARMVVQNVANQLTSQMNVVTEQAYSPMQQMVQQVVGGIWVGEGANAFVEEVQGLMMPSTNKVTDRMGIFHKNIMHAIDTIDRADEQVNSLVNGLGDIFDAIF